MPKAKMTSATANKIYDILVEHAGAPESMRESFVYSHTTENTSGFSSLSEWRFGGELGFGGKFWVDGEKFSVSCYQEDETPRRWQLIQKVNKLLSELE